MSIDPTQVYAVVRDGEIVHVRLTEGVAKSCAAIERSVYEHKEVRVVPMILSEVASNE